jgi:hypothetical protein
MGTPNPASAAVRIMTSLGLEPDPWQLDVLQSNHPRLLLNCCRQAGKSTIVAVHALLQAIYTDNLLVLLLSRSHRQSIELFGIVTRFYERIGSPLKVRQNVEELVLANRSRIVCLPCREETIRGYSGVGILIIDEAARVPEDLFRAVLPMLAVSDGRLIAMSTPWGKQGFFYEAWTKGGDDWRRIEIPASLVPRLKARLQQDRRLFSDSWYRQEFECSFEAVEGQVYPDLARCVVSSFSSPLWSWLVGKSGPPAGQQVGGIDFGYRNPFAAVWGVLDKNDVLWLLDEHYARQKSLSYHADHLPRNVMWYCDPSGASERVQLQCAGFKVRLGNNSLRQGIAAVNARIQNGRLKILLNKCPNLLAEADLYRYSDEPQHKYTETPVDEHNHALAALRYLIATIDGRKRRPSSAPRDDDLSTDAPAAAKPARQGPRPWLRYDNDELWTPL